MEVPTVKSIQLEYSVAVESPCIGICKYAPNTRICVGCGRTDEEISRWMFLSNSEKQQIVEKLTRRGEYQGHGDFPSF